MCFSVRRTVSSSRCWMNVRAGKSDTEMRKDRQRLNGCIFTSTDIDVKLEIQGYLFRIALIIDT